jgi:hypothetical protein
MFPDVDAQRLSNFHFESEAVAAWFFYRNAFGRSEIKPELIPSLGIQKDLCDVEPGRSGGQNESTVQAT